MMKAVLRRPGELPSLIVGLSFGNLDQFRAMPRDTFIKIDGSELGLPVDVMIFSGETEAALAEMIEGSIGPDTKVLISDRLKS